eukprot:scaffold330098_cov81-Tisochrysis_lutea.AAC.1
MDFQRKGDLIARVMVHNLTYDLAQIISKLSRIETIERGTDVYSARAKYTEEKDGQVRAINLLFRDTYKMIPRALAEFPEMFKFDQRKEYMPHHLMTHELVFGRNNGYVSRAKLLKEVTSDDDREILFKNMTEW